MMCAADAQSTWQVMLEMLVANGNMLTLHATAQHMIGKGARIYQVLFRGSVSSGAQHMTTALIVPGTTIVIDIADPTKWNNEQSYGVGIF